MFGLSDSAKETACRYCQKASNDTFAKASLKAIGQHNVSTSTYVQTWALQDFALPLLRGSTKAPVSTKLEATTVLQIPETGSQLLAVKANWFGTYITTEVDTIHDDGYR